MSLSKIQALINNSIDYTDSCKFAAIIGESPSKGARSPKLWNAAFYGFNVNIEMLCFDVSSGNLSDLLEVLADNQNFIGGAIAVPHKVQVSKWLGASLMPEAKGIGAVNCLFRGDNGQLIGTNTDGEASRIALVDKIGSIEGKNVLILGAGGSAKAVAAYINTGVGALGSTIIACRNNTLSLQTQHELGIKQVFEWSDISTLLPKVDIVINCTTVGTIEQVGLSPLSSKQLALMRNTSVVYDINYQPNPTQLLINAQKIGLLIIDGLSMNLEQAVTAFKYAMRNNYGTLDENKIKSYMITV